VVKDRPYADPVNAPYFEKTIESAGFPFTISEEGAFEPAALVKHRTYGANTANTPSSSSSSTSSALDAALRTVHAGPPGTYIHVPEIDKPPDPKSRPTDLRLSPGITIRDIYESLLSASYYAISSCFCARTGAIPLSSRALLLPHVDQNGASAMPPVLASLRIYLTTTGSFVVSISHSFANNLTTLSESPANQFPPVGVTVLAAPLGLLATCEPHALSDAATTEGSLGQSPDTQLLRLRAERDDNPWKILCSKLLQSRTLSLPTKAAHKWVGLRRLRRKPVDQSGDGKWTPMIGSSSGLFWPATLCFCKALSNLTIKDDIDDANQFQATFDPLTAAKAWFSGTAEREALISRKKKEREDVAAQEAALTEGHIQTSHGLSPLTLQRPGPSMGGMYPTPPDVVQGAIGVAPSNDGHSSSPNINLLAQTGPETDMTSNGVTGSYGENWGATDVKRERERERDRISTSFESENLFGELGPDMFGDNDITEADFNFFDEQPDDSMDLVSLDLTASNPNQPATLDAGPATGHVLHPKAESSQVPTPDLAPTFAKPELRHARSSLVDEPRRQTVSEMGQGNKINKKRPASPFNPDTVFKRIRASLDNQNAVQQNSRIYASHHSHIFDKVDFGPGLSAVNSKYEGSGRFDFSMDQSKGIKPSNFQGPPTTDYLRRHGKSRKNLKDLPAAAYGELFARVQAQQNPGSNRPSPQHVDGSQSDAEDASVVSDQDDSSYDSDEPLSPVKSSSMRRRRGDDDGDSLATSFRELDNMDTGSPYLPSELLRNGKLEVDIPLAKYFADPEPPPIQYSLPDDQFIMTAQILTDQVTTSTMFSGDISDSLLQSAADRRRYLSRTARNSMKELQHGLPSHFHPTTSYQLRSFVEVQDVPLLGQPTRLQPRPPGQDQMRPSNLFQIPSPRLEMRRYESRLSVLPSATSFWESLGLSPTNGIKDITALCIYPNHEGLSDSMLVFTEKMRSIYESLKLGSFSRLFSSSSAEDGLFPFDVEKDVVSLGKCSSFLGPSLQNCASDVCKALASIADERLNFVLFFVYTPEVMGSMVECCAAFNEIFEGYRKALTNKKLPVLNELVLQLIPQSLVASSSSIPMPSPMDLSKLALEIYDRCMSFGSGGATPSPAVLLEQTTPRLIDFKLSPNPSASVLHENTCLHIGYAQSIDERWITVAWTDNTGSQQMTTSYCLGRKGKALVTPLADVIHEIWATTRELISAWKVHWRVIVAKSGVMDAHEIELWSGLAQTDSKSSINLTVITVDTDPSLQLLPPAAKISGSATSIFYTTPASTPQGAVVSPEQSGNAATPFRDNGTTSGQTPGVDNNATESDADATLADVTDQSWGVVLCHRLHNSTSLTDLNSALVSGYLIKRGGVRVEDPPVLMEVNIIYNEGNPRAYEPLLREMLMYYRGLGTLARVRGMVDKDTDIRPWHIAAAEKGVRALYMLM
jgi:mediator of RNA polymerase II transcription subunit 13, fungi type